MAKVQTIFQETWRYFPALVVMVTGLTGLPSQADPAPQGVRVVLGRARAAAGEEIRIPLRMKARREVRVGAVGTTVRFDPARLEFVSATPGRSVKRLNGQVVAAERAVSGQTSELSVGIMTIDPEHFGERLQNGVLAWLTFRVRAGTHPGVLLLEIEPEVAPAAVPAVLIEPVRTKEGRIVVKRN